MLKVFAILSVLACAVYSQSIDKTFCDIDSFPEAPDAASNPLPIIPPGISYECDIEQNSEGATVEIKEWYNGLLNMARSQSIAAGLTLNQYVYPTTGELLDTIGTKCVTISLNTTDGVEQVAERTPFLIVKTEPEYPGDSGQKVVAGTFGILNATKEYVDRSLKVKYLGNMDNIRGIPAKKWVGCLFDKQKVKTTKVIIHYSDSSVWTPAHTVADKTVPVQVEISSKIGDKIITEINSILRYREKNPKEESIFTEQGVFCPGRSNQFTMVKFPRQFRTTLQISHPKVNSFGMGGNVSNVRTDYDLDKNYMMNKYYQNDQVFKELHDWNTGLLYKQNMDTGACRVSKMSDGEALELSDLFKIDGEPEYQWTGEKRVRGINCNAWISVRNWRGVKSTFEYYFATALWQEQGGRNLTQNNPILGVVTPVDVPFGQEPDATYFHYMDWDTTVSDLFRFDVSQCQKNIDSRNIRFEIKPTTENYELMKQNQFDVKTALTQALLDTTGVRLTRLGTIETIYHNKTIFVTFTLFDKPLFYGKNNVVVEPTLAEAESKLEASIAKNQFSFNYLAITAKPLASSYILLQKREGRFVYEIKETGETINYSMGSVIAFLVVFVLVGLGAGFATGYFLIIKRTTPLPALPGPLGFLNPLASGSNA